MKIKFCAGWDTSENITGRLLEQFKTRDNDISNIEFVHDNSYDIIVYNNYVTEEPKKDSKAFIFFHEPTWSGNHQKNFSQYDNITVFGYDKNNYNPPDKVIETSAHMFYGGTGKQREGDFWNYDNLINHTFEKSKMISSIVSSLGNDDKEYPIGCIYNKRVNLIKSVIDKCGFVDVFGWNDKGLNFKKDGLVDYRFSICIENSNEKNYISEKFYDCILTNTIPIYFGCKNIKEFLPENGYILIEDIDNIDKIVEQLNYIVNNCEKLYDEMLPSLLKIKEKYFNELNLLKKINNLSEKKIKMNSKTTIVTGLWDLGRDALSEGWSRSYENHYLQKFDQLLDMENNMIIFGDSELESFVFKKRTQENTLFVRRNLDWFKNNAYFEKIQNIRNNTSWLEQAGWLKYSTQAKLEYYNPLVMSKMFLLNDAVILDRFDSSHFFWIDAGIANTVHSGYFTHDKIQNKLKNVFNNFGFVAFPYDANNEIHGFSYPKINEYAGKDVKLVARGGLFGGSKHSISEMNGIYYNLLNQTLDDGYMGTEESLFSIIMYRYPSFVDYVEIDGNGLVCKFCEDLKNDKHIVKNLMPMKKNVIVKNIDIEKVGLYVISFNSPKQFETLIESMLEYDKDFIEKPRKFLLDNSVDLSTTPRYVELCEQYGFEHIKKNNIGICGGRQFVSDHFHNSDLELMIWSEDDFFFQNKPNETCKNGFNRYCSNLYQKCLEIIKKENFDFLKLNFTEFYGDSSTAWAWYNVPSEVRARLWPNNPRLPVQGLDPNAPLTEFKNIKSHKELPYVTGNIYYSNWTHFVTKEGNRKMFQETKWAHPFENTWMSYIYQETIKGNINPALLLLTPVEHNRFHHYSAELRREN